MFIKNDDLSNTFGASYIPNGWIIISSAEFTLKTQTSNSILSFNLVGEIEGLDV